MVFICMLVRNRQCAPMHCWQWFNLLLQTCMVISAFALVTTINKPRSVVWTNLLLIRGCFNLQNVAQREAEQSWQEYFLGIHLFTVLSCSWTSQNQKTSKIQVCKTIKVVPPTYFRTLCDFAPNHFLVVIPKSHLPIKYMLCIIICKTHSCQPLSVY